MPELTEIQQAILELTEDLFHDPLDIAAGLFDRDWVPPTDRRELLGKDGIGPERFRKRKINLLDEGE